MKELLQSIKEALFDAPSEVKESYNKVVEYFEHKEAIPCWEIVLEKKNPRGKIFQKVILVDSKVYQEKESAVKATESKFPDYKVKKAHRSLADSRAFTAGAIAVEPPY